MSNDPEDLKFFNPEKYLCFLSERHRIDIESLRSLCREYDLVPKGKYAPDEEEHVPGLMRDIAGRIGLPTGLVWHYQQVGVIGRPITYRDLDFLTRQRILREHEGGAVTPSPAITPDSPPSAPQESYEVYVYKRYLFNAAVRKVGGRILNPEDRISMTRLAWEVRRKFNLEMRISEIEKKIISPIRRMAQNDRKKAKEKGIPLTIIAEQRLAQTRLEFQ